MQLQRLQPPPHPHASACFPCCAHAPPTNPPSRWPPMSPKRWRLIQMEDDLSCKGVPAEEGDHRIKDESVDVDNRVGDPVVAGLQETEVTPASCPTSSASKVIEYCCELELGFQSNERRCKATKRYLPWSDLTVKICRFSDICLPPSSFSRRSPSDASNESKRSSLRMFSGPFLGMKESLCQGSTLHNRIVASWEPDARVRACPSVAGARKARLLIQSSWPERAVACTN